MRKSPEIREREVIKPTITYIDLMRHAPRFAGSGELIDEITKEKLSWQDTEDLTPEGIRVAREYGSVLPEVDYVVGVASTESRAAQTADLIREGSGRERGLGASQVVGINYKELSLEAMGAIKKAKVLIEAKAREYPNYGRLLPEARAKARELAQKQGLMEIIKDEAFIEEAAEGMAYNVLALYEISKDAVEGQKTALPMVNHGGFNESFLKKTIVVEDEKGKIRAGFDDIEDIGGFFKPGESFRIKITRVEGKEEIECEFTNPERQKFFQDKKIYLDWEEIKKLAGKFEHRLIKKEEKFP